MNKNYLLLINCFLLSFIGLAQAPVNDNPENATMLTIGTVFLDNNIEGTNVNATDSQDSNTTIPNPDCGGSGNVDVWYTVTVGVNGLLTIQTDESTGSDVNDTVLEVYSGGVNTLTLIDCNDDGSGNGLFSTINLSNQTPNDVLYIRVLELSDESGTFQISAYSPAPPANDEPETGTNLVVGTTFDENKIESSNVGATDSSIANTTIPALDCGSYQGGDVWYTTTVGASGSLIVEVDYLELSPVFAVYSGASVNALVLEGCEQFYNQISFSGRTPGEILYIRAWNFGNDNFGSFEISVYDPQKPINDDPINAIALVPGETFADAKIPATNIGATDTVDIADLCIFYDGGDIWYTVTVGATERVMIEVSRDGLGVALYSGTATALVEEETCKIFENPFIFEGRTAGETLFVRVFDFGNNEFDNFEIGAISADLIVNDTPESATSLPIGVDIDSNPIEGTMLGASDSSISDSSCGFYTNTDVWFSATVGENGNLTVETSAVVGSQIFNTDVAIYSGTTDALVEEACSDDKDFLDPFTSFSKIELTGRTAGEVLYIRVWVPFSTSSDTFLISAYDGVGQTLSIDDITENKQLSVYPNPTTHSFTINSQEPIENLKLYNLNGHNVLEIEDFNMNQKIDISHLPSGLYLIKSTINGDLIMHTKILKH